MSKQLESDTMAVIFNVDFSKLPVSAEEVHLVRSYLDELLTKMLMQEEEDER